MTAERRAVCASLAEELAQVILRWDSKPTHAWYGTTTKRSGVVASMVHIFAAVSATTLLDQFADHVLADKAHYGLHAVLIPDVKSIYEWLPQLPAAQPAATRLLQHCLTELRAATAHPIEPPTDWTRTAELRCKCEDCRALSQFLGDPAQSVGRFRVRQDRRQHLHRQIEIHHCDCTHVTDRKGSPQTLVCTKTQSSYERRLQQYHEDQSCSPNWNRWPAASQALRSREDRAGGGGNDEEGSCSENSDASFFPMRCLQRTKSGRHLKVVILPAVHPSCLALAAKARLSSHPWTLY